jgi:rhodanese-related sulfurtransferase
MIFDVRSSEEFVKEHVKGAINIPINRLGSSELAGTKPSQEIVLYCPDTKLASLAISILKERGFENVRISEELLQSDLPIVSNTPVEIHAYKH